MNIKSATEFQCNHYQFNNFALHWYYVCNIFYLEIMIGIIEELDEHVK